MPVAAPTPRLIFPLSAWSGPAGVALIQGLIRNPVTGDYFISQADNVKGQKAQNVVIRRHRSNLDYVDSRTVVEAGHGSSVGIEEDGDNMIWLGHQAHGVGRFPYDPGPNEFKAINALPKGDVSIHRDVACVRNLNRYRGYKLSDAKIGRTTLMFDFTIPKWGNRFQGHAVVSMPNGDGLVCVHRDMATKKESRAVAYTFEGVKSHELDTTKMGDEAEGFLVEPSDKGDTTVWVVKRTGGLNKNRVVVATFWLGKLAQQPMIPVEPADNIKRVFAVFGVPAAVTVSSTVRAARQGYVSRYTHYVQKWLIALGYYTAAADGQWGPVTQNAFDNFRRKIRPAWPESDCIGEPGITSLTLLRNAAVKATGKDQLKVIP